MLKKSLTLVLLLLCNSLISQTINIPDSNFEQALIDLGIDSDGVINQSVLYSDIENVYSLDLSAKEISDLTGISSFSGLRNLDCSSNLLTDLTIPSELQTLDCSSNKLASLPNVPKELTSLDCSANLFETLSFSGTFLITLKINQNPNLTTLVITNNNNIPNITYLNDGGLRSVTVSQNQNLSALTCSNNKELGSLIIDNNPNLHSLELDRLESLQSLDLSSNPNLSSIDLTETKLSSLDLSSNSGLYSIYLLDNHLSYLDIRNGNNAAIGNFYSEYENIPCILVDDALAANAGEAPYSGWDISANTEYRSESCEFDIQISTDKTALTENGEVAIITATLNEVSPNNDVTVNLAISGTVQSSNYELSSDSIVIPAGQLSASVNFTALEDTLNEDKTAIIGISSTENADVLTPQELTIAITNIESDRVPQIECPEDMVLNNDPGECGAIVELTTTVTGNPEPQITYEPESGSFFALGTTEVTATATNNNGTSECKFTVTVNESEVGLNCNNGVNCLTVEDAIGFLGDICDINLTLDNTEIIKGFQFDITFPDGFVFDPLDITSTGLPEGFQVSCASVGGNSYRVVGYSLSNATLASGTASILAFPTFINQETQAGEKPIPVTNVILSDVDNHDIASLCPTTGIITVYSHPIGDANGDDAVNILDILGTVDYILGNPPSIFYFDLADVNSDDIINILDVLGIQDIILGQTSKIFSSETKGNTAKGLARANYLVVNSNSFSTSTFETIEINLENEDIVKGFQFDFVLPEGFTLNPEDIFGSSRLDGFNIIAREVSENTYRVITFSLSSATVGSGSGAILNLPVFIEADISNGVYANAFTDVIISNTTNTDVSTTPQSVGEISIGTLGIDNLENYENRGKVYPNPAESILNFESEFVGDYNLFDLNGRDFGKGKILLGINKLDASMLQSGLYIIKISNDKGFIIKKFMKK